MKQVLLHNNHSVVLTDNPSETVQCAWARHTIDGHAPRVVFEDNHSGNKAQMCLSCALSFREALAGFTDSSDERAVGHVISERDNQVVGVHYVRIDEQCEGGQLCLLCGGQMGRLNRVVAEQLGSKVTAHHGCFLFADNDALQTAFFALGDISISGSASNASGRRIGGIRTGEVHTYENPIGGSCLGCEEQVGLMDAQFVIRMDGATVVVHKECTGSVVDALYDGLWDAAACYSGDLLGDLL